jgi:hypothetical protein
VRALPAHEPHASVHDRHKQHRDRVARRAALAVGAGWPFRIGHRTLTAVCRYRIRGVKTRAERWCSRCASRSRGAESMSGCAGAGQAREPRCSRSGSPPLHPAGVACFSAAGPCRQLFPPSWKGDTYIAIPGRYVVLQLPAEPNAAEVFDRRKRRVVLPSCTGCGAANTWVAVRTQHFLFIGCPRCAYLWSVRKPEPDPASA